MRIRDLIFPPVCGACGELLAVSWKGDVPMLCPECEKQFKREMMVQCKTCYLPLADCRCTSHTLASRGCVAHVKLAPFSDTHQPIARGLVLALKKSADKRYYRALAKLLLPSLEAAIKAQDKSLTVAGKPPVSDTVISFLPRTSYAKRLHGVDQAACLAEALAEALHIRVLPLFRRTYKGLEQKSLSRGARLLNAKQSLVLRRKAQKVNLTACRVILVDDVVTTGASMAAAAELLPVREWMAVSIAVTPKGEKQ